MERYLKHVIEDIAANFDKPTDDFAQIAVLVDPRGQTNIVQMLWRDNYEKGLVYKSIIEMVKQTRANKVGMVTSAWSLKIPKMADGSMRELEDIPMPSESPDRIEIVAITIMDGQNVSTWVAEIIRYEDKPPTLGDWEDTSAGIVSGAMVDPIQDALKEVYSG